MALRFIYVDVGPVRHWLALMYRWRQWRGERQAQITELFPGAHRDILLSHLLYQDVIALWTCVARIYNHAPTTSLSTPSVEALSACRQNLLFCQGVMSSVCSGRPVKGEACRLRLTPDYQDTLQSRAPLLRDMSRNLCSNCLL